MPRWSKRSAATASLTIFLPVDAATKAQRFVLLKIAPGYLALWHDLLFRILLVVVSMLLLGGGGALLTLLLQAEGVRREPPAEPPTTTLWLDVSGNSWMSRWLLVFGGRDALGRHHRVALFADQLRDSDHARLRRLLLRLQRGQRPGNEDRFDLL